MTGPVASPPPSGPGLGGTGQDGTGWPGAGWRGAIPEIIMATAVVAVIAAAAYALAGLRAVAVIVVISAAGALVVLRALVLPPPLPSRGEDVSGPDPAVPSPVMSSFSGLWRRQSRLADAQASMPAYEASLRRQLENLLASRLAERHGISLYDDPAEARRVFARGSPANDRLWWWIDPARPAAPPPGAAPAPGSAQPGTPPPGTAQPDRTADHPSYRQDEPGISYRTLARLIDRLERL